MQDLTDHGVVVILKQGDKILFVKDSREPKLSKWAPPHGRCEIEDKTEEDSVIREVREEAGLKVRPVKKLWTVEADINLKTISFWKAEIEGGEIKINPLQSSEYNWFTIEEALKLELYPATRKFLELVKSGKITL